MKEHAIQFYRQGYNCSACLLKAAERRYNQPLTKQCYNMCQGVNTGFGIGGMCSVLIAAVMVFGLFFDEQTIKRLRIKLLNEFQSKHRSLNCSELIKARKDNMSRCEAIIAEVAGLVEKIIDEERRR